LSDGEIFQSENKGNTLVPSTIINVCNVPKHEKSSIFRVVGAQSPCRERKVEAVERKWWIDFNWFATDFHPRILSKEVTRLDLLFGEIIFTGS
jgi:hypothetical protein